MSRPTLTLALSPLPATLLEKRHARLLVGKRVVCDLWRAKDGRTTWHTWDRDGVGGCNATDPTMEDALANAVCAVLFQGFVTALRSDECMAALKIARDVDRGRS